METRLTTLETKWDTVIPTLATRADLIGLEGRLRDETRQGFIDLQRWLMTAMQRCLGALLALGLATGGGVSLVLNQQVRAKEVSAVPAPALAAAAMAADESAREDEAYLQSPRSSVVSPHAGDNPADDLS